MIARNGKPLVRLVPCAEERKPRKLVGAWTWKGKIWIADDFNETPQDLIEDVINDAPLVTPEPLDEQK